MYDPPLPVYIGDTHALFWCLKRPGQLSAAANAAFRLSSAGGAHIIVPAIVVAEYCYLTEKMGASMLPSVFLAHIARSREFIFSELGQAQLESMEKVGGVPEMHDRLIAAEALAYEAPVISKDEALRASGVVDVIW